jgi:hypothetical protein
MNKYTVYTYTVQCVGGGGMVLWASERLTPGAKSLYKLIFLDDDIFIAFYMSYLSTVQSLLCYGKVHIFARYFDKQYYKLCVNSHKEKHCCYIVRTKEYLFTRLKPLSKLSHRETV